MNKLSLLSTVILILSSLYHVDISAQTNETSDFSIQINKVQKYVSISPDQLAEASTLSDLNHYYKSDWVKVYKTVETEVISNGKKQKLITTNSAITPEQKQLIQSADNGSSIDVIVKYLPNNTLSETKVREMDFSFKIDPAKDATCANGEDYLDNYLSQNILTTVTLADIPQYQVAAVNFTVDAQGNVVDAHIAKASNNKVIDEKILKTVCEMPTWKSAEYADGTNTKQDFVLTVGDHYSCTMNLLDIKSEVPPSTKQEK